jgi:hypothetical protein
LIHAINDLRALAAGKDVEEVNDVLVFGEDAVVVEVDVIALGARTAREHIEEVNNILIFGEDAVVVEVDVIARDDFARIGNAVGIAQRR